MSYRSAVLATLVALSSAPATAATVVETRDAAGQTSTMTVQGPRARIQMGPQRYVLIDTAEGSYYAVDVRRRVVMNMGQVPEHVTDLPRSEAAAREAEVEFRHVGSGPRIAGYPTEHYRLYADGRLCQQSYLSRAALDAAEMAEFLQGFHRFSKRQQERYRALGVAAEPCEQAEQVAAARHPQLGMPMKIVANGQIRQEVLRLRTGVDVPAQQLEAPAGFRLIAPHQAAQQPGPAAAPEPEALNGSRGTAEDAAEAARRRGREMLRRER